MIKVLVMGFTLAMLTSCISKELRAIDDPLQVGVSTVTVIADGGASAFAPANTFAAFDKAQTLGAVACRVRIQLSKNGQPILFDSGLSRSAHPISLPQLFERYGMTFAYDLNLSGDDKTAAQAVLQVVKDYGLQDNVVLSSFSTEQLTQARQLDSKVTLSYVIDDQKTPDIDAEISRANSLGFNAAAVRAAIVTAGQVKRARALHLSLTGWGARSDDELKHAVQAGVGGLTTTAPDHLITILKIPRSR